MNASHKKSKKFHLIKKNLKITIKKIENFSEKEQLKILDLKTSSKETNMTEKNHTTKNLLIF